MRTILPVALMLTLAGSTWSQSKDYVIVGAGAMSCGIYLSDRSKGDHIKEILYGTWLQGYLSGANTFWKAGMSQEAVYLPDSETTLAYIDKYCRENPLEHVEMGAFTLFMELAAKRHGK
jgi:hypothetical protein